MFSIFENIRRVNWDLDQCLVLKYCNHKNRLHKKNMYILLKVSVSMFLLNFISMVLSGIVLIRIRLHDDKELIFSETWFQSIYLFLQKYHPNKNFNMLSEKTYFSSGNHVFYRRLSIAILTESLNTKHAKNYCT